MSAAPYKVVATTGRGRASVFDRTTGEFLGIVWRGNEGRWWANQGRWSADDPTTRLGHRMTRAEAAAAVWEACVWEAHRG